jgi:hypothetical protein
MADEVELPVTALLAWGREWQHKVEAGPVVGFNVGDPRLLGHYLKAANDALEREAKRPSKAARGGRPRKGMGVDAAALIANGVPEDDAVRMVANQYGNTTDNVREALRKHRAQQAAKIYP